MAVVIRFSASRGPLSVLASFCQAINTPFALGTEPSARLLHTTVQLGRGTKNLDWYVKAVRRLEVEKTRVPLPVFPDGTLHGRQRARAFIDLKIGEDTPGAPASTSKIVVELADDIVPTTVHNFLDLCQRPKGTGYIGSDLFKVQKGFALYFGDILRGDGRGSTSSFPVRFFPDENFIGRHSQPGVLAMASAGVHSNGSIFYVTMAPAAHLDGKHVVFGRVLTGMDTLTKIGTGYTVTNQRPAVPVSIVGTGIIAHGSVEWAAADKAMQKAAAPLPAAKVAAKAAPVPAGSVQAASNDKPLKVAKPSVKVTEGAKERS